ncbi:MAG: hypothetical protein ABIX28_07425 [Vicinamibacterales bacterium]
MQAAQRSAVSKIALVVGTCVSVVVGLVAALWLLRVVLGFAPEASVAIAVLGGALTIPAAAVGCYAAMNPKFVNVASLYTAHGLPHVMAFVVTLIMGILMSISALMAFVQGQLFVGIGMLLMTVIVGIVLVKTSRSLIRQLRTESTPLTR